MDDCGADVGLLGLGVQKKYATSDYIFKVKLPSLDTKLFCDSTLLSSIRAQIMLRLGVNLALQL